MPYRLRLAIATGLVFAAGLGHAVAQDACHLEAMGTAEVASVRDGRTLMLRDGRELRLAAIETTETAKSALEALAAGKTLTLKRLGAEEQDRYGRIVAFAFLPAPAPSLQQAMLEQGVARVSARVGDKACAEALLTTERAARAAQRGLWTDPNFAPLPADNVTNITAKRGLFALVEGKVLSVHASGSTTYVNFSRRWSRGFSVTIASRLGRAFAAAGVEPRKLESRRIRVRGWIEQRNGPIIEVTTPEQIEFIN
jgi:endonuclease YncB( thermonuclease family)